MNNTSIDYKKDVLNLFSRCFPGFKIKENVVLVSAANGQALQADLSISGIISDTNLHYLVSTQNAHREVETDLLDEFSQSIIAAGAQKGFYLGADGFCNSMKLYAYKKGIELVSIGDAVNGRWQPGVGIPVVHIHYGQKYFFKIHYRAEILLKMIHNYRVIKLDQDDLNVFSFENEDKIVSVNDYVIHQIQNGNIRHDGKTSLPFSKKITFLKYPSLQFDPADVELHIEPFRKKYLRYVCAEEFDKVKGETNKEMNQSCNMVTRPAAQINDAYIRIDELPVNACGFTSGVEVSATI